MRALAGRTVLITGAGRGIGREFARWTAAEGANLVVCARSTVDLDALQKELADAPVLARAVDVADFDSVVELVDSAVRKFGGVDAVIANAGILGPVGPIDAVDPEDWIHTLDVNVGGVVNVISAALPSMRERGWGRILTMSGAGAGGPRLPERVSAYVASKAAVMMFTEVIAAELPPGVTINAIAPGAIPTGFGQGILDAGRDVAGATLFEATEQMPMPDLTPLHDLLLYLLSDESDALNGRCLSARWDPPAQLRKLDAIDDSRFRLRRIDDDLYGPKQ